MASLTDLFNPQFLMFLGILLLAIALLVLYFESKFRDQNHKISSMLSLVSSLAEELNNNKMMVNHLTMMGSSNLQGGMSQNISNPRDKNMLDLIPNSELIDVSDDDDEDDDDEDEDEDDDDEDEDAASNSTDSDNENPTGFNLEENDVIQIGESFDVKVLKINISEYNENIEDEDDDEDEDVENDLDSNACNLDDLDELAGSDSTSSKSVVGETNTEEFLSLECNNVDELENVGFNQPFTEDKISLFDFKSINISSLEEESKEVLDFKKMSIPKLRSIVIERGLSTEASKLKKGDLLKLLEGE
jgi:hypothetical protein